MRSHIMAAVAVALFTGVASSQARPSAPVTPPTPTTQAPNDPSATSRTGAVTVTEATPGLLKKAKISSADAIRAAQAKWPNDALTKASIEEQRGALVYLFDFSKPGTTLSHHVEVDATTGKVTTFEGIVADSSDTGKAKPPR